MQVTHFIVIPEEHSKKALAVIRLLERRKEKRREEGIKKMVEFRNC